jgi:hypothetical protein
MRSPRIAAPSRLAAASVLEMRRREDGFDAGPVTPACVEASRATVSSAAWLIGPGGVPTCPVLNDLEE